MRLVSISDNQRAPVPRANFVATVYHGLPRDLLAFDPDGGDYLAFIGRISPEKRPDRAIEIAKKTGMKLKIAAKIDPADKAYFTEIIEPLLDNPLVEFVGEIGEAAKQEFLGGARALLFPIDWPEPFGLVMIEAMAVGHTDHCLAQWVGPRSDRAWPQRLPGRKHRRGGRGGRGGGRAAARRRAGRVRGTFQRRADGAQTMLRSMRR